MQKEGTKLETMINNHHISNEEFERAENVPTSNSQLYKQAGNSIVVDVLEELFCMLLDEKGDFYI